MPSHRVVLFVHHHDGSRFSARHFDIENGVVSGLAVDDFVDRLRVDGNRNWIFKCAVNDPGDHPGASRTARFILAARITNLRGHYRVYLQFKTPLPQVRVGVAKNILSTDVQPWVAGNGGAAKTLYV